MNDELRRIELAHFLRTRRGRLTPSQVHLPDGVRRRRTPGLRREELAQIAGIGLTWYTKLEQGQDIQVSAQVLESLSHALQLTPDERAHLFVLAREQLPLPPRIYVQHVSAELQCVLDAINPNPVYVANERLDVIGWNRSASQVFGDYAALSDWERNLLWLIFSHPYQRKLYMQWEQIAKRTLAVYRANEGLATEDAWFVERRDELMRTSPEFRAWWPRHDVGGVHVGRKILNHPEAGLLILQSTTLLLGDAPNLRLFLYTPLPEEDTAQKLVRLQATSIDSTWITHTP